MKSNLLILTLSFYYIFSFAQEKLLPLSELNFAKNYTSLDSALKNPEKVYKLSLLEEDLEKLPSEITKLQNLQYLALTSNKFKTFPEEIFSFKNLQILYLNDTKTSNIPSRIGELKNLKQLYLHWNSIKALPQEFKNLQKLEVLDLGANKFKNFPEVILEIKHLQDLYLYGNKIKSLPENLAKFEKLKNLRLGANKIKKLPENIIKLDSLEELHLPDNKLKNIPEKFSNLKALTWLDITHNRFRKFPPNLLENKGLKYLSIWDRGFGKENKTNIKNTFTSTNVKFVEKYEGSFWGINLGFQQGKFGKVELGITNGFKKDLILLAYGVSGEYNLNGNLYGAKFSGWLNAFLFSLGLHTIYYEDIKENKNTFAIRPEIGFGKGVFNLVYGYNAMFHPLKNANKHQVSLRFVIPFSPFFTK